MIEEGAAVRFSMIAPAFQTPGYAHYLREWHLTEPAAANYAEALLAVERLLEINPEAIRVLRREDPNWRAITPERIRAVAPGVSDELAATLCEVRVMRPDDECELAAQQASSRHL
ncbi:hypothetical protein DK419_15500 [Methylobacterium terrae]|uniref:Uncharacterized protein n=2 Tax=Methylobacterium terrae TaxID=2202827 RepID=A0A2U8WN72_9HYPH|nr:hypothetical protein DK419_15500 [Methylobacterium terrae]